LEQGIERLAQLQVESEPDCRRVMRQDHVPMQVLPCAQIVAGQGTCQCEAINGVKAACADNDFEIDFPLTDFLDFGTKVAEFDFIGVGF
jgi:hypothetical protein